MGALLVRLGEVEIGVLEAFVNESQRFTFCESYCAAFRDKRPVLGQIFEDRFPNSITVGGPICWFSHLLPQGVMRQWRCRLLGIDLDDSFGLLRELGLNMPGAVILTPTESVMAKRTPIEAAHSPLRHDDDGSLRFSLAGAQWKLSAKSSGRGLTTAAEGDGKAWIAKFHAPEFPGLPQCEFATMTWAMAAGVATPDFDLRRIEDFDKVPEEMSQGDGKVYVIERFDRLQDNNNRRHIEDFGQILDRPPGDAQYHGSYEEIASVLKWIAPESAEAFFRLVVFNVLCGNGDAHLKNFSIIYPDTRNAQLAPAYDLVATCLYYPLGKEKLALKVDGQKEFRSIHAKSFDRLIECLGMSNEQGCRLLREYVKATIDAWNDGDVKGNFSSSQKQKIGDHLARIPLANELWL